MSETLVGQLRAALRGAVLTEPADCAPFFRDWLGKREGRPLAVARPGTTEEVAAVLRLCAGAGVGIVPQGGNTGMVGGAPPDGSGRQVILSLSRLNRIRTLDPLGDVVVAEAG
jgi:FAD/FMN-containing dehydrogenase